MDAKTVANTILSQMGGAGRIAAMTGAKHFLAHEDECGGVSFRFPNRRGPNHVKITLTARDLYKVVFSRIRKYKAHPKGSFDMIFAEQLKELFETETGLYLSFF